MRASPSPERTASARHWAPLLVLALLAGGGWSLHLAAQDPPKKPPVEEEEKSPTKAKPLPVPDDEPATPASARTAKPTELAAEAERPGLNPQVRRLYSELSYPHDEVVLRKEKGAPKNVWPLPRYLGPGSNYRGPVEIRLYGEKGKLLPPDKLPRRDVDSVRHYEEIALQRVDELKGLPPAERVEAAEKALAAVQHFHQNQAKRLDPESAGWKKIEKQLYDKLLAVRLERLHLVAGAGDWVGAYDLARQLREVYADPKVRQELGDVLAGLVEAPLKERQYNLVQLRYNTVERDFPGSAALAQVRNRLQSQAAKLLEEARAAEGRQDRTRAGELTSQARNVWPRLPGLHDFQRRLSNEYPILGVGVRSLPRRFSPATAVTDSERRAVELLFESLVRPRESAAGSQTYVPGLASLPRLTSRGREFRLDVGARWSNDQPVTEADVRQTVQLLAKDGWPGFAPEWADLIEPPAPGSDRDRVALATRQGFLDPLSLMTFKVLPAAAELERPLIKPTDDDFAANPVGSGPFVLTDPDRRRRELQAGAVAFVANPYYQRAGKPGMPYLQEIRFFQSKDPRADFTDRRLHLLLDPTAEQVRDLRSLNDVTVQTLRNRRVYFLAVNHRGRVLQNILLRKALAHAIDRTRILNEVFRGGFEDAANPPHRPLAGPYPPDSWASSGKKTELFDLGLAKQEAAAARQTEPVAKLSLKYPADDPRAAEACKKIQEQVRELGIELELEAREPHDLHREVEVQHQYDLAYYGYDYPSEAYWLWPLFNTDPRALDAGGRNYLGYQNDGELESYFREAMLHRDFTKVREATHRIDTLFADRMPFIPLWQLDTVIASHRDLTMVNVDPLAVFTEVEKWKLNVR